MSQLEQHPAPAAARDLLHVRAVRAGYGSVAVLEDVSLRVAEGEVVTVLGPNGAGKTTLLRVISGVVPARAGRIETADATIRRPSAHAVARSGIGHVPEGRGIFPGLTVLDNLDLGSFGIGKRPSDSAESRLTFVFDLFPRLGERKRQRAGTLSGGEQQMLAIGRALMGNPQILLLDEPSLGLSPLMVQRVFDALEEVRARGLSILLVEQNLTHALALADRGYVMNRGQIVLEGTAEELKESDMFSHYVSMA